MKIAVSNLAWDHSALPAALTVLADEGAEGVEVAPTKIADWKDLNSKRLVAYRSEIESAGLRVSSLQAIFFGKTDVKLLSDEASFQLMTEHMRRVAEVGSILGAEVAVYGAPGTRLRGDLEPAAALELASERLRDLGDIAAAGGIVIGIEPVPPAYGGDFLNTARGVTEFVRDLNHPAIKLHLDTGCAALAGENIGESIRAAKPWLRHFHIAEPHLAEFFNPLADHSSAAKALREVNYANWISIEMREQPHDSLAAVKSALRFVQASYLLA